MMKQIEQQTIDLYVKAVDLAKSKAGLSNQDKVLLNRFKMLLRSGATKDADNELAQMGKVRRTTLHTIRELAESVFEDWVRNLDVDDTERERMLYEGKRRADVAEEYLLNQLKYQGIILEN